MHCTVLLSLSTGYHDIRGYLRLEALLVQPAIILLSNYYHLYETDISKLVFFFIFCDKYLQPWSNLVPLDNSSAFVWYWMALKNSILKIFENFHRVGGTVGRSIYVLSMGKNQGSIGNWKRRMNSMMD